MDSMTRFKKAIEGYYEGLVSKGEVFGFSWEALEDCGEAANVDDIIVLLPDSLMDEWIGDIIDVAASDEDWWIMWSSGPTPKKMPYAEAAIRKWCNGNKE